MNSKYKQVLLIAIALLIVTAQGCNQASTQTKTDDKPVAEAKSESPEYCSLRPEVEKQYGYTHAVKIGNDIKISRAVSMDDKGNPTAK